jgi:acetyltransferase-like isoleucine patch superfamily enzyme
MSVSPDTSPVDSMIDADVRLGYPTSRRPGQRLELARGARLRSGTVLYDASRIGASFETGHGVVVREDCQIGEHVSIWSNTVVDYGCHIGDRVKIHANCYIAQFTVIEHDAFLAPGVTIANDLYPGDDESARLMAGPHIGARAQIGVNVTILPFVRIGAGALIGSGSVVTRDIEPGMVAYGNPALPRRRVADLPQIGGRVAALAAASGPRSAAPADQPMAGNRP